MTAHSNPNEASATSARDVFPDATEVLEKAIAEGAFPGCAFGVLAGDRVLATEGLGHFTYELSSPSVSAHTVFDLASVSKVVATTAMAMLLHQHGKLHLDTRLGSILPAFLRGRSANDPANEVTLRNLLAHNSGLPGYVEFFRTVRTPQELFESCLQLPLESTPGQHAEYSDPGFILLGKALELLAKESLSSFVRREICVTLGMSSTNYCPAQAERSSIPPTELDTTFRNGIIQGEVQDENAFILNGVAGHAGLFSNVADLMRFAQAILNSSEQQVPSGNSPSPFFARTVELFAQRQEPQGSSRAIGWDTPSKTSSSGLHFSPHSIGHLGFSGCSLWIDLDARIAVVLLTNRTWPDRKSQLIRAVRPAFHDAVRKAIG